MAMRFELDLKLARSARLRQLVQLSDFENNLRSSQNENAVERCYSCGTSHGRQTLLARLISCLKVLVLSLLFLSSVFSVFGRINVKRLALVDGLHDSVKDETQAHDFEQFVSTTMDLPFFHDTLLCVRNIVWPNKSCKDAFAYSRVSSVAAALRRMPLPLRDRAVAVNVFLRWAASIRLGDSTCALWPSLMKEEAECLGLLALCQSGIQVDQVTTNSWLTNQTMMWHLSPPVGTRHMLHYSENSRNALPKPFHDRYVNLLGTSTIDSHWVWTEDFARYLRITTAKHATAVGPILLYPLSREPGDQPPLSVIFFEVYPVDHDKWTGGVDPDVPLYSAESQMETLALIQEGIRLTELELHKPIFLQIRPKRNFVSGVHSQEYLDFRNSVLGPRIILANPGVRQDSAVRSATVTLAYPWSSAISLAHFLNRHAAGVATQKLSRVRSIQPSELELLTTAQEVSTWLKRSLSQKPSNRNFTQLDHA